MNRQSSAFLMQRAYEHLTSGAAAIALTAVFLMSVNASAGSRALTPSVSILVPTVEIEVIDENTTTHVLAAASDRVNG